MLKFKVTKESPQHNYIKYSSSDLDSLHYSSSECLESLHLESDMKICSQIKPNKDVNKGILNRGRTLEMKSVSNTLFTDPYSGVYLGPTETPKSIQRQPFSMVDELTKKQSLSINNNGMLRIQKGKEIFSSGRNNSGAGKRVHFTSDVDTQEYNNGRLSSGVHNENDNLDVNKHNTDDWFEDDIVNVENVYISNNRGAQNCRLKSILIDSHLSDSTCSPSTCSGDTGDSRDSDVSLSGTYSENNSFSNGTSSENSWKKIRRKSVRDDTHSDMIRKTLERDFGELLRKTQMNKEEYRQRFDKYLTADRKVRSYLRSTENLPTTSQSSEYNVWNKTSNPYLIDHTYQSNKMVSDVPDYILTRIFSYLSTRELCRTSVVSKEWYKLCWNPELWNSIDLCDMTKDADDVLEILLNKLSSHSKFTCLIIHTIKLSRSQLLSDEGLKVIGQRCPELNRFEISRCPGVTGEGIGILLANCPNLSFLNISGCDAIDSVDCDSPYGENASFLQLRFLDLSDCMCIDDSVIERTARCCSFLEYLYLRRCKNITDKGVIAIATYCTMIREISISDCYGVKDSGIRYLVKRCSDLRYLSVAKCQITDASVKYIAKFCKKIRYVNLHSCPKLTDESIARVSQNCTKLRALDIGKCNEITDMTLNTLAVTSIQLRRLSVKGCSKITDSGLRKIATHCKYLRYLNLQECNFSFETYAYLRQRYRNCIIEHTNPEYC